MNRKKNYLIFILAVIAFFSLNSSVIAEEKLSQTTPLSNEKTRIPAPPTVLKAGVAVLNLNSENLEYLPDQDMFVATGSAEIVANKEGVKLKAKKITYDVEKQTLTAEGNVRIIKNGLELKGDFSRFDLARESSLLDNPNTTIGMIKINAQNATMESNNLELLKGNAVITEKMNLLLSSDGFGMAKDNELDIPGTKKRANPIYKLKAKEIIVKSEKNLNKIIFKNSSIYMGKLKIINLPYFELSTDKELAKMETMLPVIGGDKEMGFYVGPSGVYHLQNGTTLKLAPLFVYDGGAGIGGYARIKNSFNTTEIMAGTVKDRTIISGEQQLFTPYTHLVYGSNAYIKDGFLGDRKARLLMEVVDERKYYLKDLDMDYKSRLSAGYAQDYNSQWGTGRFKIQGDAIKARPFIDYGNKLQVRVQSQFDVTVYGSGQNFALIRVGPYLESMLGPLKITSAYYQGGWHGDSPFLFDKYCYGKSNFVLGSTLKLNRYMTLGYVGSANLTKDNWDKRLLAENTMYVKFGPEDFKLRLGYDTVRKRTDWGVDLLIGTENSEIGFDKMKIINPTELTKPKQKKKDNKKVINL